MGRFWTRMNTAVCMLAAFVLWTTAVSRVDVQPIGPQGSKVGFAAVNAFVHHLTGVHMSLYTISDWLSLIPVGFAVGFAILGLIQWIRRRSLMRVDFSLLMLGCFYLAVVAVYVLFECVVVNYRPVLIEAVLEASYPSSTTLLFLCVMPTAIMQLRGRVKRMHIRKIIIFVIYAFTVLMVFGRLISGVHWFTDIVGGVLLSAGLVMLYSAIMQFDSRRCRTP